MSFSAQKSEVLNQKLFLIFGALTVVSCWLATALETWLLCVLPVLAMGVYWVSTDIKSVFFVLMACIPISTEYNFTPSFGTDLPTEPLIVGLMFVYWLFALKNGVILRGGIFLRHTLTFLIFLHLAWTLTTTLTSQSMGVSLKYFLAKTWYIVTFYFLAAWVLRSERDFKRFFWSIFIPLSIAIVITLYRYSFYNFDFAKVEKVMNPMFRNHVNYACIMVLFLPYIWIVLLRERRFSLKWWVLLGTLPIFIFAIQTSYTRAAYIAGIAAIGYYFVVKWRLTKISLALVSILAIGWLTYVVNGGKYLDYAPNFEKTVTHRDFSNLVEATAKGEDISTMERVYRWVAGFHMVSEQPLVGFGPNNFVNFYKKYSVSSFKTYVSENKDNSTIHCYYLLVAVEQGIVGFLIFMALVFYTLILGERVYHNSTGFERSFAMASTLSFFIILLLLLINDLIETDKIGSFFFMQMAVLVNLDLKTRG